MTYNQDFPSMSVSIRNRNSEPWAIGDHEVRLNYDGQNYDDVFSKLATYLFDRSIVIIPETDSYHEGTGYTGMDVAIYNIETCAVSHIDVRAYYSSRSIGEKVTLLTVLEPIDADLYGATLKGLEIPVSVHPQSKMIEVVEAVETELLRTVGHGWDLAVHFNHASMCFVLRSTGDAPDYRVEIYGDFNAAAT